DVLEHMIYAGPFDRGRGQLANLARPARRAPAGRFTAGGSRRPPRTNPTSLTPLADERSASRLPTPFAASILAPVLREPRMSFSSEEADARVWPFASSITCA